MTISTQTRYAVRFLLELSNNEDAGKPVALRHVASAQGISEAYLETIALKLRKHKYLKSTKGAGGGYFLAMPLEEITLGEIMRLMENKFFQVHCTEDAAETCSNYNECRIAQAWELLEDQIGNIVDNIKLSQLRAKVE
jgi:Rrf2 family protein